MLGGCKMRSKEALKGFSVFFVMSVSHIQFRKEFCFQSRVLLCFSLRKSSDSVTTVSQLLFCTG